MDATNIPSDLDASAARVVAMAAHHGVTGDEIASAEARATWTLGQDLRILGRLGVKAASQLSYPVYCWAITCLAVTAELVAVFAQDLDHDDAVLKAAALVRQAARR